MKIKKNDLPRITIITPSYNQGNFIEQTICSVLTQNYPNLEYIIIDGGSTDNTVEIIKKYESDISYWVSESDRGQTHAINKGLEKATGDIIAYLNSDDYYLPDTLFKVAKHFQQFPKTDLLYGRCQFVNENSKKIGEHFGNITKAEEILNPWDFWWSQKQIIQPETFWSKRITEKIGLFREELYYVMDYEYWCRIICAGGLVNKIDIELSCFRYTDHQKTTNKDGVGEELLKTLRGFLWDKSVPLSLKKRLELQGKWIYHSILLNQIEQSIVNHHSRARRWFLSTLILFRYPQILFVSSFRNRSFKWLTKVLN